MKKKLLILFICILISGLYNCVLGVGADWDFVAYHYYNAYAVLHGRLNIDLMPAGIQSYLNPFLDIINYLILKTFHNYKYLVMFIQGIYFGVLAFILYLISDFIFSKVTNENSVKYSLVFFATVFGATECITFSEIGMSHNDIPISVMILSSLYLILKFLDTPKFKYIIWSGLMVGIATGCKLTSGIFVLSLIVTLLLFSFKKGFKYNLKIFSLYFSFAALGFLLIDGYWMYLLYQKFGNPFFPIFNGIFKSKYYAFVNYHDTRFDNVHSLYKLLCYPLIWSAAKENHVCEPQFSDSRHALEYFACIFSTLVLFIKFALKKKFTQIEKSQVYIVIFSIVSYFIWIKTSCILRYLMPVLSLAVLIVLMLFVNMKIFIKNKMFLTVLLLLLLVAFNINYMFPRWGRSSDVLKIPKLQLEENSVVLLLGKPISYVAANSSYKNVRFIYLDDGLAWDGEDSDFVPSEDYYKLVDSLIIGKKKYLARQKALVEPKDVKPNKVDKIIKKRYLNSKMKCTEVETEKYLEPFFRPKKFEFCEFLD